MARTQRSVTPTACVTPRHVGDANDANYAAARPVMGLQLGGKTSPVVEASRRESVAVNSDCLVAQVERATAPILELTQ